MSFIRNDEHTLELTECNKKDPSMSDTDRDS